MKLSSIHSHTTMRCWIEFVKISAPVSLDEFRNGGENVSQDRAWHGLSLSLSANASSSGPPLGRTGPRGWEFRISSRDTVGRQFRPVQLQRLNSDDLKEAIRLGCLNAFHIHHDHSCQLPGHAAPFLGRAYLMLLLSANFFILLL